MSRALQEFQHEVTVRNIVARYREAMERQSIEFPSQEAFDAYMKKHPNADPKNHSVKKQKGEGDDANRTDVSKHVKEVLHSNNTISSKSRDRKQDLENTWENYIIGRFTTQSPGIVGIREADLKRGVKAIAEAWSASVKDSRKLVKDNTSLLSRLFGSDKSKNLKALLDLKKEYTECEKALKALNEYKPIQHKGAGSDWLNLGSGTGYVLTNDKAKNYIDLLGAFVMSMNKVEDHMQETIKTLNDWNVENDKTRSKNEERGPKSIKPLLG